MFSFSCGNRGQMLASAAAFSLALSQGQSQEQLEFLAAFFTVVADNLALFALCPEQGQGGTPEPVNPGDNL